MTTPITGTVGTPTQTASPTADRADQMGKDTFLKLLVAQMKYQDPSNPASSSDLMAQNAELLTLQRSLSAGALVGKHVAYTDETGATVTGAVSSVLVSAGSEPRAIVGDKAVPLGRITEITVAEVDTPTTSSPTTSTPASTTPTSTTPPAS
jgi:flagellar basal-body rod modification protein FlgD